MWKWTKRSILGLAILAVAGYFCFGDQVASYVWSSGQIIQETVHDSVPFEFQIRRARNLLDDVVPQVHANIKLIAKEEVEIAGLEGEIATQRKAMTEEAARLQKLRDALRQDKASYEFGRAVYTKGDVVDELGRRFENFQMAEVLLASKEKLLANRRTTLAAAQKKLDQMRIRRVEVESEIEQLESQFRVVQAEAATSKLDLDDGKLAQIHSVLTDLRKRLEVSQRVLAHESRFIENIPVDAVDEASLLESIDQHFAPEGDAAVRGHVGASVPSI